MMKFDFRKKHKAVEDLSEYTGSAVNWEEDRLKNILRSRTIGWILAAVAILIAVCEAFAIVVLAPGKEKIPYLMRVDNSTGIVDEMITVYDDEKMKSNKALIRFFLKKYIDAREGYDHKFAKKDYETVFYMSEASEAERFKREYKKNNPARKYGEEARINIKLKTLELVDDDKAIIRFMEEHIEEDMPVRTEHYLVRINYEFIDGAIPQHVRDVTPLGFVIASYAPTRENFTND